MYYIAEGFLLASSLILYTFASPVHEELSSRMVIPPEAHRVAFDEVNKRLVAFDGEGHDLGHYHPSAALPMKKRNDGTPQLSCTTMNNEDIRSLPGINVLRDYADLHISKLHRQEVVNDDHRDTRNMDATVCTSEEGVQFKFDAHPDCSTLNSTSNGTLSDGFVMLEQAGLGYTETVSTVVRQSTLSSEAEFEAKITPGEIFEGEAGKSDTMKWMNKHGHANRVRQEATQTGKLRQLSKHDIQCFLTLSKETCVLTGSADVWLIASGWLWFEYRNKVGPEGDKHYKWAVHMDKILPNDHDRGSVATFRVSGDMKTVLVFHGEGCTDDIFETIMPSQSGGAVPAPTQR